MSELVDHYAVWVARHCRVFGFGQEEMKTVLAWKERFMAAGYTADDLTGATDYLITHPECLNIDLRYQGKMTVHLSAIQARIHDARAVVNQRAFPGEDRGQCTRCQGGGLVIVPHLGGIVDGEWERQKIARGGPSYYRMAVVCNCALGNWMAKEGKTEHRRRDGTVIRMMALNDYARVNPRWEIQMAGRLARQSELAAIEYRERQRGVKEEKIRERLDTVMESLISQYGDVSRGH